MESKLAQNIASKIDLNGDSLRYILQHFHLLSVSKNEVLIRGDQEQNQKMFFVEEGCLRIYFVNEEGVESTRHLIFENHFATALTNFITNEPSIEYIQALEDSQVYYISKSNFFKLLDELPIWEKFYRTYLEYAYVTNTLRLKSFITLDAKERYRMLLAQNPQIVRRLSNKIVASYLGISQETLSRLKSKL